VRRRVAVRRCGQRSTEWPGAAVCELVAAYGEALDSIAAQPTIMSLSRRPDSQGRIPRRFLPPGGAKAIAAILADMHVAARVDTLLRRGQRFRAIDPVGRYPLDVDRLHDFRDSLSPVRRRTLAVWVVLVALAIAFPVAWITDHLRALAPQALICSSRFSVRAAFARFAGHRLGPVTAGCRAHPETSLVEALGRVAHLNLSLGSVIDAFTSVRAS
jgi:hypothetical protein